MKDSTILTISVVVILLTAVPGFVHSLPAFIVGSIIGLALVGYFLNKERPWTGYKASITSLYFSGILALGAGLGVFLILPTAPRYFAAMALVDSIPFVISLALSLKFLKNILPVSAGRLLSMGNGFLALLLFVFVGGIIGRFMGNFYELIVVYSGFLIMGILAMMYFRK
ncbi:hypothetical protein [Sulfuracidifex tepidarius]|uniref:Uncharacterized protein n=1 Tax=Sulfuracidifex tepidarius TaxID=1294262 RepID=A0A510E6M4_9CREN|nr:hypothetical protein [Sulfuracidifex tepidarius]BBG25397.1 hypothetical protein IC006_2733 [Sulfuracidifex tepidarius]BBG28191.1 hypothetical protein IC007_2747 [Sulfuracidifex tepidarius]